MSTVKAFLVGVAIGFCLRIATANSSRQLELKSEMEARNCWCLKVEVSGKTLSVEFVAASEAREE
jgi:hypothetical protein